MKIEMGESLFYSWLRHVKECQVVQTNWKPSPSWLLQSEDELKRFMNITGEYYQNKYSYEIYKSNSLMQLLMQAEVDALGISLSDKGIEVYSIDVAFHESGLQYGSREETVMRILKKLLRTIMCIVGYFDLRAGEVIFAAPKIHNAVLNDVEECIVDLRTLLEENNYDFNVRVIANEDFNELVMKPILIASDGVSDTSELFMRGYQLLKMFGVDRPARKRSATSTSTPTEVKERVSTRITPTDALSELKIGKIAQTFLKDVLESGKVSEEEIELMTTSEYSLATFDLNFPLLVSVRDASNAVRYYSKPLLINDTRYFLCSQWFEVAANNDRPFLLAWLEKQGAVG